MTVGDQARVFAAMILCGTCTGAMHDMLGIFRQNAFFTGTADLMLGVICAASVIAAGLMLGCDPFRFYALLGVGLGWTIYMFSLGIIVRFLKRNFIQLSEKVTKLAKKEKSLQENGK